MSKYEYPPGRPPSTWEHPSRQDLTNEAVGLEEALRATEKSIQEGSYGSKQELEAHRQDLLNRLESVREKIKKAK